MRIQIKIMIYKNSHLQNVGGNFYAHFKKGGIYANFINNGRGKQVCLLSPARKARCKIYGELSGV